MDFCILGDPHKDMIRWQSVGSSHEILRQNRVSMCIVPDTDNIQSSRTSCHDEYEFRTVPFTISCCKLHFYHPKLWHIKLQFSKRNKQTPLPPLPEINFNLPRKICVTRDQPRPGSFLHKREEPGNEVDCGRRGQQITKCRSDYSALFGRKSTQFTVV
jgi:hypothetical protein